MKRKNKLIRTATVASTIDLLAGQLSLLAQHYEVLTVAYGEEILKKISKREGVRCTNIDMKRRISPLHDLKSLISLYRLFRKEKPMIVHSITPKAGLLSMLAAKLARVPIRIHTFTGLIFPTATGFMKKILICMDFILCKAATHVIPEGEGVKNDLISYRITKKPLSVVANGNIKGVNLEHFNPSLFSNSEKRVLRKKLGIQANDFVFIFIGRLVGDKGVNELINSFKALSNQEVKLLLLGTYEQELDPLKNDTINEIKINENIIETGFIEDVRPYFAVSNALVFPSYREGFPNVVLEAGAMGLPSIVTNINGSNEIICDGENGRIVEPKDPNALHEAMQEFLDNPNLVEQMAKRARPMICSRFEQKMIWEAMLDRYKFIEALHSNISNHNSQ